MTRQILIKKVLRKIELLPDSKLQEVNDFADFLLTRTDFSPSYSCIREGGVWSDGLIASVVLINL